MELVESVDQMEKYNVIKVTHGNNGYNGHYGQKVWGINWRYKWYYFEFICHVWLLKNVENMGFWEDDEWCDLKRLCHSFLDYREILECRVGVGLSKKVGNGRKGRDEMW